MLDFVQVVEVTRVISFEVLLPHVFGLVDVVDVVDLLFFGFFL